MYEHITQLLTPRDNQWYTEVKQSI